MLKILLWISSILFIGCGERKQIKRFPRSEKPPIPEITTQSADLEQTAATTMPIPKANATLEITVDPPSLEIGSQSSVYVHAVSEGSRRNITAEIQWHISDPSKLSSPTLLNDGRFQISALAAGAVTITGTYQDQQVKMTFDIATPNRLTLVAVPPSMTLPVGFSQSLQINAVDFSGNETDVTADIQWQAPPGTYQIESLHQGQRPIRGSSPGNAEIIGQYRDQTITVPIEITNLALDRIDIEPAGQLEIVRDLQRQLIAHAVFTDQTTLPLNDDPRLTWQSSDPTVAQFQSNGQPAILTGLKVGTVTVTAALPQHQGQKTVVISEKAIDRLEIVTADGTGPEMNIGENLTLKLEAIFQDNSRAEVNPDLWASLNGTIATVENLGDRQGVVTALQDGTATITAALGSRPPVEFTITVLPKQLTGITLSHSDLTFRPDDLPVQVVATAQYANAADEVITDQVQWSSDDIQIATVSDTTPGLVTPVAAGSTKVWARFGTQAKFVDVDVQAIRQLRSLEISATKDSLFAAEGSTNLAVSAVIYNGSEEVTEDLSLHPQIAWTIRPVDEASQNEALGQVQRTDEQLAFHLGEESVILQASLDNINSNELTITLKQFIQFSIETLSSAMPPLTPIRYKLTGELNTGDSGIDITSDVSLTYSELLRGAFLVDPPRFIPFEPDDLPTGQATGQIHNTDIGLDFTYQTAGTANDRLLMAYDSSRPEILQVYYLTVRNEVGFPRSRTFSLPPVAANPLPRRFEIRGVHCLSDHAPISNATLAANQVGSRQFCPRNGSNCQGTNLGSFEFNEIQRCARPAQYQSYATHEVFGGFALIQVVIQPSGAESRTTVGNIEFIRIR